MRPIVLNYILALGIAVLLGSAAAAPLDRPASLPDPGADPNTLRAQAAKLGLYIGSATDQKDLAEDSTYQKIMGQQFNLLVPNSEMKWQTLHREEGNYDFGPADELVDFAVRHGQKVRGHALAWDIANPDWLKRYSGDGAALEKLLVSHIQAVIGHYRKKYPDTVIVWDVVNEVFANSDNTVASRKSIWSAIGSRPDDYIALAFRTARAADPNATLCLNDYSDSSASRTDAIFKYLKSAKEAGVPIDCYGIQMHIGRFPTHHYTDLPSYEFLKATYQRFASIGVQVQITEMDFSEPKTGPDIDLAASYYRNTLRSCIEAPNCTALNFWDFSAKYSSIPSWWPGPDYAPMMPWDADLHPTAIFDALYRVLEKAAQSGIGPAIPGTDRAPTSPSARQPPG